MTGLEILLIVAGVVLLLATGLHTLGVVLLAIGAILVLIELVWAAVVFKFIRKTQKDFFKGFRDF